MLVWRLNLAWKSGHPNQCLRLGDDAKTDRTLRARFRESASYGSPLSVRAKDAAFFLTNKGFKREAAAVLRLAPLASNISQRHFGHGTAISAKTGRVKCLMWPQRWHFHASDRFSWKQPRSLSACSASPRILSKICRSTSDVSAIDQIRVAAGGHGEPPHAAVAVVACSCSFEHL